MKAAMRPVPMVDALSRASREAVHQTLRRGITAYLEEIQSVCRECHSIASSVDDEAAAVNEVVWPCATAKALEVAGGPSTYWGECAEPGCKDKLNEGDGAINGPQLKVQRAIDAQTA